MKSKIKAVDKRESIVKKKHKKRRALKKTKTKGKLGVSGAATKSSIHSQQNTEKKNTVRSEKKSLSLLTHRADVSITSENAKVVPSNPTKVVQKKSVKRKQRKKAQKLQKVNVDHSAQSGNTDNNNVKSKVCSSEREKSKTFNEKKLQKLKLLVDKKMKQNNTETDNSSISRKKNMKSTNKKINIKRLKHILTVKENEEKKEKVPITRTKQEIKKNEPESLRDRMMAKLKASRFRYLNETLYNNESSESRKMFKEDPDAFTAYHEGYKQQVEQWPLNPLDIIIDSIKKMPKDHIVADFGCGEARLAESVPQNVHSFDLVAVNDRVKACDMAHTPLLMDSVHVVVFCLSLMGNNLNDYIIEANRILKKDGILKIAEVESRFEQVENFIKNLKSYGFVNTWKDLSHNLFYFMDFKKGSKIEVKRNKLPPITLKSCLYKKR